MLLAIGGVAIAAVAGTVVADRQAKARLAEYDAEWRKALAAERERSAALRLPVLSGETLDGNAAAMYRTFCSTLKRADAGVVSSASSGPPLEGPLAPPCAKLLSDFKAVADSMRDATRCARCDWEIRYEDGLLSSSPSFHEARALALLLVLSAHEREGAGDVRGAAQDDLAACRFGVDLSHGTLIGHTMGAHAVKIALSALASLVARRGDSVPLAEVDSGLEKLEAALPPLSLAFERDRLLLGSFKEIAEKAEPWYEQLNMEGGAVARVVPASILLAQAQHDIGALMQESERLAAIDDRSRRIDEEARLTSTVARSWNPLVRAATPTGVLARRAADITRAYFKVARTAIHLEQERARAGRFPKEPELPLDPFGLPAKLRYEVSEDGSSYRLWSVGPNGRDDQGLVDSRAGADDIALSGKARGSR